MPPPAQACSEPRPLCLHPGVQLNNEPEPWQTWHGLVGRQISHAGLTLPQDAREHLSGLAQCYTEMCLSQVCLGDASASLLPGVAGICNLKPRGAENDWPQAAVSSNNARTDSDARIRALRSREPHGAGLARLAEIPTVFCSKSDYDALAAVRFAGFGHVGLSRRGCRVPSTSGFTHVIAEASAGQTSALRGTVKRLLVAACNRQPLNAWCC